MQTLDLDDFAIFELDMLELQTGGRLAEDAPANWRDRIPLMFPAYVWYEFSQPHVELWEWAEAVDIDTTPKPFVALWPRGRGKSTNAEIIAADLGARGKRQYCMYVCETQDQADKHVATIRNMLESDHVTRYFPKVGTPRIGKNGGQTWRRNIVTAENGFTVEAIGLDKAVRGQKIDWVRPDLIIFDDIDAKHDTDKATEKKEDTITTSILPAGSSKAAILFVQNVIKKDSIADRLSKPVGDDGAAGYMGGRIISGPHKAVEDLVYSFTSTESGEMTWTITAGRSNWTGFDLDVCEYELGLYGPSAFEKEAQHNIDADDPLALLESSILDATRVKSSPDLYRVAIGCDPSGGAGQVGIVGGGIANVGKVVHGYTLIDYSTPKGTPASQWGSDVLRAYHSIGADCVYVERNFGGDMAKNTIRTAVLEDAEGNVILTGSQVPIVEVNASRGKAVRAEPVASLFQRGICHHVGFFPELEKQWTQWQPGTQPSPDRLDAEVWMFTGLGLIQQVVTGSQRDNPFFN